MLRRAVALVAFILLALAQTPRADEAPRLPFPKVDGWENTDLRPLPAESGGGYTVGYNCAEPRIAVTIYVFNRGNAKIEDNLTSAPIREEFNSAKDAVLEAARRGIYKEAKEEESGEATLGADKSAPKALHARFHVTTKDGNHATSEIYVLPYHNYFIKLRVTRVAQDAKTTPPPLEKLYAALAKMLTA